MGTLIRTLGYTAGVQRLVWPSGTDIPVTAYLWGGGGGRGGVDSSPGGAGQGGGFTQVDFFVNGGDIIEVAVGGAGGPGASGRGGVPGGTAGASYDLQFSFDTRTAAANPGVVPSTNSKYTSFLNTYGVWVSPTSARNFDRSYVVNFPVTGEYTFTGSVDNYGSIYVDDVLILEMPGESRLLIGGDAYRNTFSVNWPVEVGEHTVRIVGVNTGGPGSIALTIGGGGSYSGGRGGNAGRSGASGAGGGGGGATVIFKNGVRLAVAGGGGGGGGGGNRGAARGQNAPGTTGQAADGVNNGQNGQNKSGDGGGGGGGGGGLNGGNGGLAVVGDQGGLAGTGGSSSSPAENPSGPNAGGRGNPYYPGSAGQAGVAGAAVLLFEQPSFYVHTGSVFTPVKNTWVNLNDTWVPVQSTHVNQDGVWQPLLGSFAPAFTVIPEKFGIASRSIEAESLPPPPPPSSSLPSFPGGGDGGNDF